MFGQIAVEHLASAMLQNQEYEQHPQPGYRNNKEVNRYDLSKVNAEKRLPRLRRWPWNSPQDP